MKKESKRYKNLLKSVVKDKKLNCWWYTEVVIFFVSDQKYLPRKK